MVSGENMKFVRSFSHSRAMSGSRSVCLWSVVVCLRQFQALWLVDTKKNIVTNQICIHGRFQYTRKAFKWHHRNCGAGIKTINQTFGPMGVLALYRNICQLRHLGRANFVKKYPHPSILHHPFLSFFLLLSIVFLYFTFLTVGDNAFIWIVNGKTDLMHSPYHVNPSLEVCL